MIPFMIFIKDFFCFSICSRKDASYELDYCYEQDDDMKMIYSREIKPLILDIFGGKSATVIAYGARGSGKTCTIQVFLCFNFLLRFTVSGFFQP